MQSIEKNTRTDDAATEHRRARSGRRAGGLVAGVTVLALLTSGCKEVSDVKKRVDQNNAQASIAQGEPIETALNCASSAASSQRVIIKGGTSKTNSAWTAHINVLLPRFSTEIFMSVVAIKYRRAQTLLISLDLTIRTPWMPRVTIRRWSEGLSAITVLVRAPIPCALKP